MPGSKSSKKLRRRKTLPRVNRIPEPTLPSTISTETEPFKLPKKRKPTATLRQAKLKIPTLLKKTKHKKPTHPKKPKNTYKKGKATLSQPKPKKQSTGNQNLGSLQREKAINRRLEKGYPIEIAVLYWYWFDQYKTKWDNAETDEEREKLRREAANPTQMYGSKYIAHRGGVAQADYGAPTQETVAQLKDRLSRLHDYYEKHPESRLKTGEESEDTEVFTDTKAQTVEKEVEKAETKAQKASDSSTEATPANLIKVRDDLYLSKDRVYRIARKNNKWKVQKLNKSRNIYEFLFYTSTLKEAAEKIATA